MDAAVSDGLGDFCTRFFLVRTFSPSPSDEKRTDRSSATSSSLRHAACHRRKLRSQAKPLSFHDPEVAVHISGNFYKVNVVRLCFVLREDVWGMSARWSSVACRCVQQNGKLLRQWLRLQLREKEDGELTLSEKGRSEWEL